MLALALLLSLITFNYMGIKSHEVISPLKNILNALHREPVEGIKDTVQNRKNVKERWMVQPLDHFADNHSAEGTSSWYMRFMVNSQYYRVGGPIFIFVGGEWEISGAYLLRGHMHDMAREHGGMLYYTEHRFYGKSWPAADTKTGNLQYLSSQQALADLAQFILQQKNEIKSLKHSPVILTGGSYSASLVTWFTKQYPGIATAGWASSAPLYAKADFYEYLHHVGDAIKSQGGAKCYQRIAHGIEELHKRLTRGNAAELTESLKLCSDFDHTNTLDLAAFFNNIDNYFAAIVQSYSKSIKPTCEYLMSLQTDDDFTAFTSFLRGIFWPSSDANADWCISLSYAATKQLFMHTDDQDSELRQWFYQTCHEFGWYTTSSSPLTARWQHPFGHHVELTFFEQLCEDAFGPLNTSTHLTQHIAQTNSVYGGEEQSYDNVLMTHGQLDPWRAVGLQHGRNVIVIPGYSHTPDLGSVNVNDTVAMSLAKIRVSSFVRGHIWRASNHYA